MELSNEIIEREEMCLKELKSLINEDAELSKLSSLLDDKFLSMFVRGRKCDVDKAYSTLKKYFEVRRGKYKDIFENLLPSKVHLDSKILSFIKERDAQGRTTYVSRLANWDPDEISVDEFFQIGFLYLETMLSESPETQRGGVIYIVDCKGFSFKQMRQFMGPYMAQKMVSLYWGSFPLLYKEFHVVNSPWAFTVIFNILKPFFPAKAKQRLSIHSSGDLSKFHEIVSPKTMPLWLGGELEDNQAFDFDLRNRVKLREAHYQKMNEILYG